MCWEGTPWVSPRRPIYILLTDSLRLPNSCDEILAFKPAQNAKGMNPVVCMYIHMRRRRDDVCWEGTPWVSPRRPIHILSTDSLRLPSRCVDPLVGVLIRWEGGSSLIRLPVLGGRQGRGPVGG